MTVRTALLFVSAMYELARYDMLSLAFGRVPIPSNVVPDGTADRENETLACAAIDAASCFYVKPVLCLQRSVCAVRLLRRLGSPARLVIGFRAVPFLSHAWVEVDGRTVNDSPSYRKHLTTLLTR